jgi:hypothetical protein
VSAILCCVNHFMFLQPFYDFSVIYKCVSAIFLCVSHYMMWQPFLCCGSHFRFSQSFPSFVLAILCPGSHFMLSQSFSSCVPTILCYVSYFMLCQSFYFLAIILCFFLVILYVIAIIGSFSHFISVPAM